MGWGLTFFSLAATPPPCSGEKPIALPTRGKVGKAGGLRSTHVSMCVCVCGWVLVWVGVCVGVGVFVFDPKSVVGLCILLRYHAVERNQHRTSHWKRGQPMASCIRILRVAHSVSRLAGVVPCFMW